MISITFYSYKGGVSRSLALSNIATRLSELGKSVCVLDFDLEAPGLHFKFGEYKKPPIDRGIVDYIDDAITKNQEKLNLKDYSVELIPYNKHSKKITLIPAGRIDNNAYWSKLSSIDWRELFYKEDSIGVALFLALKEKISQELNPDFLLIDSRTGITDIAGITLRLFADEIVILAANNDENKDGSIRVLKNILNPKNVLFDTPNVNFILTRVPYSHEEYAKEKELRYNIKDILKKEFPNFDIPLSIIHSDRRLEENEQNLLGKEIKKGKNGVEIISIENDYLKIFDIIFLKYLSSKDIVFFNKVKKAEELIKDSENDNLKLFEKIELIKDAIKLDSNVSEYYERLGKIYFDIGDYKLAILNYEKAINLNPDLSRLYIEIGSIYFYEKDFEKALEIFDKLLYIEPNNAHSYYYKLICLEKLNRIEEFKIKVDFYLDNYNIAKDVFLNLRANYYRRKKEFKLAEKDIKNAIEITSKNGVYFGTLAEIEFEKGDLSEFLFNLAISLEKGTKEVSLNTAKDVYYKVKENQRFIELLEQYNLSLEKILA